MGLAREGDTLTFAVDPDHLHLCNAVDGARLEIKGG